MLVNISIFMALRFLNVFTILIFEGYYNMIHKEHAGEFHCNVRSCLEALDIEALYIN